MRRYKGFGSFHGENVEELVRRACRADWRAPTPPELVQLSRAPIAAPAAFGRALRAQQFAQLDASWTFLNHGAFGAPCAAGLAAARAWREHAEAQPLRFIDRELFAHLVEAARRAARWLGASPADVVLVPNATHGLNAAIASAVAASCAGPADAVVSLDVGYGSVGKMIDRACARAGGAAHARVRLLADWPASVASGDAALARVDDALRALARDGLRARVVVVDAVTSNTASALPAARLAALARERGALSVVDAAHAPGGGVGGAALGAMLGAADAVVGNLHKWACAPRGCAFVHVARDGGGAPRLALEPPVVSHGHGDGVASGFIWRGAHDYSPLLALPSVIDDFWEPLGGVARARAHQRRLLRDASDALGGAWSTAPPLALGGDDAPPMALVELPPLHPRGGVAAKDVQDWLHYERRIEVPVKTVNGKLYVRISAGLYNELDEYLELARAVRDLSAAGSGAFG